MLGKFFKVLTNNVAVTGAKGCRSRFSICSNYSGRYPRGRRGSAWRCRTPRSLTPRPSRFRAKPSPRCRTMSVDPELLAGREALLRDAAPMLVSLGVSAARGLAAVEVKALPEPKRGQG
jgi:hypothetical protein